MDQTILTTVIRRMFGDGDKALLDEWIAELVSLPRAGGARITDAELRTQARDLLEALSAAVKGSERLEVQSDDFTRVREFLTHVSASRAAQGFSPTDTANFVLTLKRPLLKRMQKEPWQSAADSLDASWTLNHLIDQLALYTTEIFQKSREEMLVRQQDEIAELSTPVVKLWDGVVALPLIGTLDSSRTQVVMETLLQAIVDENAAIAIIDITGVPTVDTLVAQHLLKTVSAARLMGADCIVSGIRPQIAQTMVHLGVELDVQSKASLADAFALALRQTGRAVVKARDAAAARP